MPLNPYSRFHFQALFFSLLLHFMKGKSSQGKVLDHPILKALHLVTSNCKLTKRWFDRLIEARVSIQTTIIVEKVG